MLLPAGSQDYIGKKLDHRAEVNEVFRKVVHKRNYKAIETPVIEYANTFANKHVGMELRTMLKWFNSEGEIEVLRPDWTTAIARALMRQDPTQLKWFYQGSVFRIDKDGTESCQAGIEIVQTPAFLGETECLFTAVSYLKALDIDDYLIELGHTGIFETLIAPLKLTETEEEALRQAMNDKRKDLVYQIARDKKHEEIAESLTALIDAYGNASVLDDYRQKWSNRSELVAIIDHLIDLVSALKALGFQDVIVDLGKVKQLPYYCGTMFRGYLRQTGTSCFSGGRYDKLYKQFDQKRSAVGLAFDVDVLSDVIKPTKPSKRICLLASEHTHVKAEKLRENYAFDVVEILYELPENHPFDQVIRVDPDNEENKVVKP